MSTKAFAAVVVSLPSAGFRRHSPPSALTRKADMKKQNQAITRRDFLKETAGGAGIFAMGSGALAASIGLGRAASAGTEANPFAYNVERLRKTDPKLIHYEQVGSFRSPHEDSRRIAVGPDDRVYIAAGNYVSVLDRDGSLIADIAFASETRCMAAAGDGPFTPRCGITSKCSTAKEAASQRGIRPAARYGLPAWR